LEAAPRSWAKGRLEDSRRGSPSGSLVCQAENARLSYRPLADFRRHEFNDTFRRNDMKAISWCLSLLAIAGGSLFAAEKPSQTAARASQKPNLIWIMADDKYEFSEP
jgi:hypothetical protein